MAPILLLEGEKLRQLARIIRNQEIEAVKNIQFKSPIDQDKYLKEVGKNYQSTIKLLDDGDAIKKEYTSDEIKSSIAHEIYTYVEKAVNIAIQAVRNFTLRTYCLSKINAHRRDIFEALKTTDPENVTNVARLAKEAHQYNECMEKFMMDHQSPASRYFSRWLKGKGTTLKQLYERFQIKRGFSGTFENLTNEQQLLVLNDIIAGSGRGALVKEVISTISGVAGIAFLIFAASMMVWDIFTAEHVIETITRDSMMTAAAVGGAMLGQALAAGVVTLVGIQATDLVLFITAVIGSVAGAFVIGTFVGLLLDSIFDSGGDYPLSTDGHHCYIAPLPDGEAVARQLAHQH